MQPDSTAKLSEPERAIFGNRQFYSVTLNMPNLNSAGGSWVVRFAELNHDPSNHDASAARSLPAHCHAQGRSGVPAAVDA